MIVITEERCIAYSAAGHPERPARVAMSLQVLRDQNEVPIQWLQPAEVDESWLLRAHDPKHLEHVRQSKEPFDGDTPFYPDIFDHARRSVGGAVQAMLKAREGKPAFSLMRPPGHHAMRKRAMGFCYLNSIAIAVLHALATGTGRAAVYDFDVHHGNGTEAILLGEPGTTVLSIHQHPCYPGTGTQDILPNVFNYPVPPETPRTEYRKILDQAFDRLKKSNPEIVAVSAGFDAYARDPLAQETLETEDFHWLGASFRKLGVPVFGVLEGGYSKDLPQLILAFLKGLEGD